MAGPSFRQVRRVGNPSRVHWRQQRLSGHALQRLPSCCSSTPRTACASVFVALRNRFCEQKTAQPGKDFGHVALAYGLLLTMSACQGGYPIEPTPCDDWCWATERVSCGFEDPAQCVAQCEADEMVSTDPECLKLWQPMVDCYLALPDEALCPRMVGVHDGPQSPCRAESASYYECARAFRGPDVP